MLLFLINSINAQHRWSSYPDTLNKKRVGAVIGITGGGYAVALVGSGISWYGSQKLTHFKWFNDLHEWKQIDKFGHSLAAYHITRLSLTSLSWAGVNRRDKIIAATLTGFLTTSGFEVYDGLSPDYGASYWDIIFNGLGSGLACANELLWKEQRLQIKYSYLPSPYAPLNPALLGKNNGEKMLKDYNGITIWLSSNIKQFLPKSKFKDKFPAWINIAVGMSGGGMLGGYGKEPQAVINTREYRQIFIAPDIDLSKLPIKHKSIKLVLGLLNWFKFPLPGIEINKYGIRGHWLAW